MHKSRGTAANATIGTTTVMSSLIRDCVAKGTGNEVIELEFIVGSMEESVVPKL